MLIDLTWLLIISLLIVRYFYYTLSPIGTQEKVSWMNGQCNKKKYQDCFMVDEDDDSGGWKFDSNFWLMKQPKFHHVVIILNMNNNITISWKKSETFETEQVQYPWYLVFPFVFSFMEKDIADTWERRKKNSFQNFFLPLNQLSLIIFIILSSISSTVFFPMVKDKLYP